MPKLRFVGVGSAFAGPELGQSNMVVEADNGKLLLIDCGQRSQDMMHEAYGTSEDPSGLSRIDGVYISHLHADHIGGLEWLALCTFFHPEHDRPKLYCIEDLMHELWEHSLKGGLSTIQGSEATLTTFFDCQPLQINNSFVWEGVQFSPVQTVHIVSGYRIMHCYGLMIEQHEFARVADNRIFAPPPDHNRIFLSGDTQFAPKQLQDFYRQASLIFHDCENTPFRSDVHAHYDDLKDLPEDVKKRMLLYHYNIAEPNARAIDDGFFGFVGKGGTFEI